MQETIHTVETEASKHEKMTAKAMKVGIVHMLLSSVAAGIASYIASQSAWVGLLTAGAILFGFYAIANFVFVFRD